MKFYFRTVHKFTVGDQSHDVSVRVAFPRGMEKLNFGSAANVQCVSARLISACCGVCVYNQAWLAKIVKIIEVQNIVIAVELLAGG